MTNENSNPVLLVISHGELAREALNSVRMIMGSVEDSDWLALMPTGSVDELQQQIAEKLDKLGAGRPAVILTDLFGGSCCNVAARFIPDRDVHVIAGFNMAMLIEFATHRGNVSTAELVEKMTATGRKAIIDVNQIFKPKTA